MKWVNEFGREIEWYPGEPWPTELPEESEKRRQWQIAQAHGGYWCNDGQHYTFGSFSDRSCCDACARAVEHYCDSRGI